MEFLIREASAEDFEAVYSMIMELATFVKHEDQVTNTIELMKQEKDYFKCLVAEKENKIIGVALYFFSYHTWVGKSMYLDDLYVSPKFRQQKVATRLLNALFEVARKENCKRVRWQVLEWNENAMALYNKIGADISGQYLNCDFNSNQIQNFDIPII